ncbi:MAG: class I SAM-dependent methyltransferase [Armatimonadota bacterium]|nr:class I SAM-dependent methyltransferase [Armatimonadota bacterium]
MHREAYVWVIETVSLLRIPTAEVVEVGSRLVTPAQYPLCLREAIPHGRWIGLDQSPGYNVDVVADGLTWEPPRRPTLVLCCEVLEHAERAGDLFKRCLGWLRPQGWMVATMAAPGRPPHSGRHEGDPDPDEWYRPVSAGELLGWATDAGCAFDHLTVETEPFHRDLYIAARVRWPGEGGE